MNNYTFDENQFDDSFLLSVDFQNWLNNITLVFWCPNAGEDWEEGRYIQIVFQSVLFFGFEASQLGRSSTGVAMMSGISLEKDSPETEIWHQRFKELAQPDSPYKEMAHIARSAKAYHFILDGYGFEGRAFLKKGFQVLCGGYETRDVTDRMPANAPKFHPVIIEAG